MIVTCPYCGGLKSSEFGETFAGTPCKCPPPQGPARPADPVRSSEWVDVLLERWSEEAAYLDKEYDRGNLTEAGESSRYQLKRCLEQLRGSYERSTSTIVLDRTPKE